MSIRRRKRRWWLCRRRKSCLYRTFSIWIIVPFKYFMALRPPIGAPLKSSGYPRKRKRPTRPRRRTKYTKITSPTNFEKNFFGHITKPYKQKLSQISYYLQKCPVFPVLWSYKLQNQVFWPVKQYKSVYAHTCSNFTLLKVKTHLYGTGNDQNGIFIAKYGRPYPLD